jgi:flagellar assembly factor FliW
VTEQFDAADIVFPDGLVGLPNLVRHRMAAIPDSELYELTSGDDPEIGFITATADSIRPGSSEALRARGLVQDGEWVLVILAVHGQPPAITANLAGPLVVDLATARARQLVIEDPDFPLQAPVAEPV